MNDFRMGQHEEAIRVLQLDVKDIKFDTKAILAQLDEKKGERRAMVKFGALIGAGAGSLATLLGKLLLAKLGLHA